MLSAADRREAQLREDEREARTNPLYHVEVEYVPAGIARAAGVPVAPELPDACQVGILRHGGAYDPRYGREEQD